MNNPYQAPAADLATDQQELLYVGFWPRLGAVIIDQIIVTIITLPILLLVYGTAYFTKTTFIAGPLDVVVSYIFPFVWVLAFWIYRQATPGKMVVGAKIISAKTGGKPSAGQLVGRYFAYILSTLPLLLGFLWAAWDPKKQTWHDKLAGTYVVRN
jgi:uncharacterized RDD family membrane protein YckC